MTHAIDLVLVAVFSIVAAGLAGYRAGFHDGKQQKIDSQQFTTRGGKGT